MSAVADDVPDVVRRGATSPRGSVTAPLLLTVGQVAQLLGIGTTRVYDLLAKGELQSVRIGRSRRIARADVVEFVERLRADTCG